MQEVEDIFEDVLPKETDTPQDQPQEKETPSGYMSKEAWTEAGKDPDEWVSEDVFKERTLRIKNEQRLKRQLAETKEDFDNRLKNLNMLSQAQLERQKQELLSRRDDAIDVADKATVKRIDKEIEAIDKQSDLVADKKDIPPKPPEIAEWEEENPWIFDENDPRVKIANDAAAEAISQNKTLAAALRAADKAVAEFEQSKNVEYKKKPAVSMADSSKSTQSSSDNVTLSWSQLSSEEKSIYDEFFAHTKVTQKDYLKTVADQRRGAK
jgi:hypothetical protein